MTVPELGQIIWHARQLAERIEKLRSVIGELGSRDANFAADLLASYDSRRKLSPKQEPWITTLIDRAENKPVVEKLNVGGFTGVIELFQQAKSKLKFPKIRLACLGKGVVLSLAGPNSKNCGSINVAGEGQYPNRAWFGRVDPSGAWGTVPVH